MARSSGDEFGPSSMSRLRIVRSSAVWRDRARAYKVVLDDVVVGDIRHGDTFESEIAPGDHSLRLKIDWTGSETIDFNAASGEVIEFTATTAGSSWTAVMDLLRRTRWIKLERVA